MIKQIKFLHQLQKGIQLEITKPQIHIQLNKGEMNNLLTEAMADPLASNAIKRILNPFLAEAFPQFPDFSQVTIGDTDEDGTTTVILKQPRQSTATPKPSVGAIEEETTETPEEVVSESEPIVDTSPEYVG